MSASRSWQILGYTLLLVGSSLGVCGLAGTALPRGRMLRSAPSSWRLSVYGLRPASGNKWARSLFAYSIVYLVAILAVLIVDRTRVWL